MVVLHEIGALSSRCICEIPQPYCQLYCVMVTLAMTGGYVLKYHFLALFVIVHSLHSFRWDLYGCIRYT